MRETSASRVPSAVLAALALAALCIGPTEAGAREGFIDRPTKTVEYGATAGEPDLVVVSAEFVGSPAVGACNVVRVTVKNQGGAAKASRVAAIVFPAGSPFRNREQKELDFPALGAGVTSRGEVRGLEIFSQGAFTLQAVADSGSQVSESNENNNTLTVSANVGKSCG